MNDLAILERIAQNPNCRAVQLADWLDQPLEDVQAALAGLIAVGDVSASPGMSPAQQPCQVYDLTAKFKDSDAYQPILGKTLAVQFATFRPDLGKTDRAVEFVRERGSATSSELHAVLGLEPDEYPSTYLRSAINSGRLEKDGKMWVLGEKESGEKAAPAPKPAPPRATPPATFPAAPERKQAEPDALERGAELGRKTEKKDEKPAIEVPTFTTNPDKPLKDLKEAIKPNQYRFGAWSDGQVEIQCDGATVAVLPRAAAKDLSTFLLRTA